MSILRYHPHQVTDTDGLRPGTEYALASMWKHNRPEAKHHRFIGLFPDACSFAPHADRSHGNLLSVLDPRSYTGLAFTVHRDGWLMSGLSIVTSVIHYWRSGDWVSWDRESTWLGGDFGEGETLYAVVPKDAWLADPTLGSCEAAPASAGHANQLRDKWLREVFGG